MTTHPVSFTGAGAASATTVPPTTATPTTTPPTTTVAGATSTTVASAPTTTLSPAAKAKALANTPKCGQRKYDNTQVLYTDATGNRFVLGPVALEGTAVSSADASVQNGQWQVNVTVKGGKQGDANTLYDTCALQSAPPDRDLPAQSSGGSGLVAVVLDSTIINTAGVQARDLASSAFTISGNFTHAGQASWHSTSATAPCRSTSDPPTSIVSATLGRDALHAGLVAGVVGFVLVGALHDRLLPGPRPLAILKLGIEGWPCCGHHLATSASSAGLALTLAGITGIIVSIGVVARLERRLLRAPQGGRRAGPHRPQRHRRSFARGLAAPS